MPTIGSPFRIFNECFYGRFYMSVSLQKPNLQACKFTGGWSSPACVGDAPAVAYMQQVPFLVHKVI